MTDALLNWYQQHPLFLWIATISFGTDVIVGWRDISRSLYRWTFR